MPRRAKHPIRLNMNTTYAISKYCIPENKILRQAMMERRATQREKLINAVSLGSALGMNDQALAGELKITLHRVRKIKAIHLQYAAQS